MSAQGSRVDLRSLPNGTTVHEGQEINLTCTTYHLTILIWISDEYIGQHYLEFVSINQLQSTISSTVNENTTATLINVSSTTDRTIVMVSTLHIRVSSQYLTFSVTCRNGGLFENATLPFQVVGEDIIINPPAHAQEARVTVVSLCMCLSVCLLPL